VITMRAVDLSNKKIYYDVQTDENGEYIFRDLRPGKYRVSIYSVQKRPTGFDHYRDVNISAAKPKEDLEFVL